MEGCVLANSDTAIQVKSAFERIYRADSLVFDEGEPGDSVYIIQEGEVELSRQGPTGCVVVARLGPGEFFGEMSAIVGERRTARATALADSRLLEVDAETLETMCVERPEIAIRIIRRLTDRLIEAEKRLSALGLELRVEPRRMCRREHETEDQERDEGISELTHDGPPFFGKLHISSAPDRVRRGFARGRSG